MAKTTNQEPFQATPKGQVLLLEMEMKKFTVGEIVILTEAHVYPELKNTEVEILKGPYTFHYSDPPDEHIIGYRITSPLIESIVGGHCAVASSRLKKLPPKDDLSSWEKCVWQPTKEPAIG